MRVIITRLTINYAIYSI